MPVYRIYFIDRANHISRPPEIIECADDQEAAEKARQFLDGHDVELWDLGRFVMRIPHELGIGIMAASCVDGPQLTTFFREEHWSLAVMCPPFGYDPT